MIARRIVSRDDWLAARKWPGARFRPDGRSLADGETR